MSDIMTSLRNHLSALGAALAQWADPDTAQDKAAAKRAGSTAIDAIDALLRDLYLLRGSLIQEIRQAADPAPSPTGRTRQRARRSPVQCGSNRPTLQTPSV